MDTPLQRPSEERIVWRRPASATPQALDEFRGEFRGEFRRRAELSGA